MTDQKENTDKTLQNVETDHTGIISTTDASQTGSESQQLSFLEDEVKKVELFTKFHFSPLKTKELQRNDGQLHGLINYLETGVLPRSQKKARRILLESSDYALIDRLLWRGWSGGAMVLGKLPVPGRPTVWMIVGQGPIALAVGAGGGCLDIFTLLYLFSPRFPSLWETARYRLKYCLKGPLNPKQPTNQPTSMAF